MTYAMTGAASTLGALLATLRGASHIHQSHHWQTRGGHYYADHLLFERLYNDSQAGIDQVAERAVGQGSAQAVPAVGQIQASAGFVRDVYGRSPASPDVGQLVTLSLAAEKGVLDCIRQALAVLDAQGQLSAGTRNLLEGLADTHETFVYLLRQRLASPRALGSCDVCGPTPRRWRP